MRPKPQPRKKFVYKRRSAAQWRRARGDDASAMIGAEGAAWLARLLNAAAGSNRLSDWEYCFTLDLDQRLAEYAERLYISEKQRAVLERIEARLRRVGAL